MGLDTEVLERLCLEFLHPFENWNSIFRQMFSENAMFPVHKWPWILNFINSSFLSPWPTFCHTGLCSSCGTTVSQYFFVINFHCFPPIWTGLVFVCGGVYCVLWCVVFFIFLWNMSRISPGKDSNGEGALLQGEVQLWPSILYCSVKLSTFAFRATSLLLVENKVLRSVKFESLLKNPQIGPVPISVQVKFLISLL